MAQYSVDDLEALPEGLRGEYNQGTDGRYYLKIDDLPDGWTVENTAGLRNTLSTEREARKIADKRLKKFQGIEDPQAALDALARIEELGNEPDVDAKVKAAREALEQQLTQRHQQELQGRDGLIDKRTQQLRRLLVDNDALAALTKHEAFDAQQLLPIIRDGVSVIEEDDELKVRVIDPVTGQPAITRESGKSGYMSIDEFVLSKKNGDLAFAFKGSGESGNGVSGGAGGPKNGIKIDPNLSPVEKLKAARRAQTGG